MKAVAPIRFHFQRACTLRDRERLKAAIREVFKKHKVKLTSLDIIFCTDDFLLDINRRYLKHDYFTDIITFDLAEPGEPVMGEVYISVDRVMDNAVSLRTFFNQELHRVIFHGVLHLCGWDDGSEVERKRIRREEDRLLGEYLRPGGNERGKKALR